jgi:prephenate dehydratase
MTEPAHAAADAAYQGTPGAFSEDAARALLGPAAVLRPCRTLEDVFDAVAAGHARCAVVPVENTLAGAVPGCDDLMERYDVQIVAERVRHIAHALIAQPGTRVRDVRRVLSHPVALAQCRRYLTAHPHMTPVSVFDTAGAVAEIVTSDEPGAAAIASRRAADVYGGVVLAGEIQDHPGNFTRFLMLQAGRAPDEFRADRKTSLVCVLPNEPGALARAIQAFAARGLNLSRIESRPIPESPFEYRFYLDVDPAASDTAIRGAMAELRACTRSLRILGHYPIDDRSDQARVTGE